MILIIDGYNLIFSDLWKKSNWNNKNSESEMDSKPQGFLEQARDNLITRLKSYNIKRRFQIIVIFDGDESIGYQSHQKESPNIEIIFSTKKSKADNLIIDIVENKIHNKNNQGIRVVTSDRLLALRCLRIRSAPFVSIGTQTIKQSGVQIMPANEFINELFKINHIKRHFISAGKKSEPALEGEPIEKFIGLKPSEVEGWLKVFDKENSEHE
ncbi:MAG: NYN domain-containing protein [Planctomycetota bacterium]